MKQLLRAAGVGAAVLTVLLAVEPATGMLVAPPAIPARVAGADLVVVGKVIAVSDKTVPAERFKGDKSHYQIVTIQVGETLSGHASKEIKLAFVPAPPPPPPPAGGKGPVAISSGGRVPPINLAMGVESVLFLVQHPTKDFYTVNAYYDVINKAGNPSFATTVADIKRYAKLLANPKPGLESKDKEERFLTAALLISRYRTPRIIPAGAPQKTDLVSVAESKLILEALAEADWNSPRPGLMQFTPRQSFYQLGLTPADGWNQPKDFRQIVPEATKWLKANAGKYRIQRYLRERGGEPAADPAGR
jgi:hypothetical protein